MQGLPFLLLKMRRAVQNEEPLRNNEKQTQIWISDLVGIIPSITGKIELVYEGEQEGPYQVAVNLVEKAIRTQFITYFPNPETLKKRRNTGKLRNLKKKMIIRIKQLHDGLMVEITLIFLLI